MAVATCLAAFAVALLVTPGTAHAYPCITRTPSADRAEADERCRPQRHAPKAQKHSSFAEFAFAGGMIVAVLLLPLVPKSAKAWDDEHAGRGRF